MKKIANILFTIYIYASFIIAIGLLADGLRLWILLYTHPDLSPIDKSGFGEALKLNITVASSFFVSSALVYSLKQFSYQQEQNRLSVFEKIFYNRLDYLDGTIVKELKYQHPALQIINSRKELERYSALEREAFLYFNELFKRKYCNADTDEDFTTAKKEENTRNEFLNEIATNFDNFISDVNSNAIKTFEMYYQNFQQIVLLIHVNEDLTTEQKEKYFDILYQQTNDAQKFHLGFMMISGKHNKVMYQALQEYPTIYQSYVITYPYDFNQVEIEYKRTFL